MKIFNRFKPETSRYQHVQLTTTRHLWRRRAVYSFFIIAFLIITPVIILYTQGYRYNLKRGKVQKTGILIVSSIPRRADVYLNSQLVLNDPTPSRIEQLLPADYDIRLSKGGYHDWNKKLQIKENATTFAEDVILWKKALPIQLAQYPVKQWLASPDNNRIVLLTDNGDFVYFDQKQQNFVVIYQAEQNLGQIMEWSNTSKKILIQDGQKFLTIDLERTPRQITEIANSPWRRLKWDLANDNTLYGLNDSGIWQLDLFSGNRELLLAQAATDFIIIDNDIYTLNQSAVNHYRAYETANPKLIASVNCSGCQFVNHLFPKLLLLDRDQAKLFIIDPKRVNPAMEYQANDLNWLNNDTLLFHNDWEIWIDEAAKPEPQIITRVGTGISDAAWHPEGRHIMFISENKIKIIELDNRELRNVIELFGNGQVDNLTIDGRGENLYFSGKISDKEQVMLLTIK